MDDSMENNNKIIILKGKNCSSKNDVCLKNSNSSSKDMGNLKKLDECYNELKINTAKTRKCYSSYKLSTYFMGDKEFTVIFGSILGEVENAIEKMGKAFREHTTQEVVPVSSVKTELFKKSMDSSDLPSVSNGSFVHSLTPPPSEIGSEENSSANLSRRGRKRRSKKFSFSPQVKKTKKVCIKSLTEEKNSEIGDVNMDSSLNNNKTSDESLNITEEKKTDVEYEIDCIKDFVKDKGKESFLVSWKGYTENDDTYEPPEHLYDCDEILEKFFLIRIEERNKCESYEKFKNLQFPLDSNFKEALFDSFKKSCKIDEKEVVKYSITSKQNIQKTKDDLMELVNKVVNYKEQSMEKYGRLFQNLKLNFGIFTLLPERNKQLALLRAWERNINSICSDPTPIKVENNVDLELPPLNFVYINHQKAGPDISIPNEPIIGCKCTDCYSSQNNCCPKGMDSHFSYTKYGKLKLSLGTPIYECNDACVCSQDCINRVVQKGRRIPLTIYRTKNGRGWGVRAQEFIRKDSFVTEYVGEVISSEEAERRGKKYDARGCTYLFDLDYNKGDLNPYTIDAAKYGNVSHFINHSCDPNMVVFNVWVNCLDPDLPRLALFSNTDIKKGDELSFDYNSGSTRQQFESYIKDVEDYDSLTPKKEISPESSSDIVRALYNTKKNRHAGTTECRCGSANCRQFFF